MKGSLICYLSRHCNNIGPLCTEYSTRLQPLHNSTAVAPVCGVDENGSRQSRAWTLIPSLVRHVSFPSPLVASIAAPVVEGCLAGLNGIILAYGQTASGKSHSMGVLQGVDAATPDLGEDARITPPTHGVGKLNSIQSYSHNQTDPGIIPRALSRVFEYVQNEPMMASGKGSPESMSVKLSLLQIYNETVQVRILPARGRGQG